MEWRERDGVRWLEAELPGARAAFSARAGGVSEGPFEGLNLAILSGDDPGAVAENRRRLAAALDLDPERVAVARQVHGAEIARHPGEHGGRVAGEVPGGLPIADGHVVAGEGLAALVLVADCLPVALDGDRGAAMLHCGWRGMAAGIVERGVEAVGATAAAIGPGIGPCCYEVGEDVLARFLPLGGEVAAGRMLDLTAVARRLLERAGVDAIETADICTSCDPGLFFSHRRDGERTGRQAGVVSRTSKGLDAEPLAGEGQQATQAATGGGR